ncbi:MAG: exonuclease SbcCD subunit D [Oscillospiraceae bacterium]|nr:exonuclease SbcCD subunit D [Oscillospiraceae bacterium]
MKFLHTADLHIGKRLHDVSFLDDQIYILEEIINIAREEKVDAVLIAGDIYQTSAPSAEAMSVFNNFISKLVEEDILVFLISGNHDSDARISYLSSLIKKAGVYATEEFSGTLQQITLTDEYGEVVINLLPFIKPTSVRRCFDNLEIETHNDAVKFVIENSKIDESKRNVLVAHQFITGASATGDEECSVGGLDNVDESLFDNFDYVALGHIHGAQKIGRNVVRYSGSPLKYSFSEVSHKKSVTIIEMKEKGLVNLKHIELTPLHDMRDIKGSFDEVMMMPYSEDYVRVTITDEIVPADAPLTITTVFPNLMQFMVENSKTNENIEFKLSEDVNKSISELFIDFYKQQNNDTAPTKAHMDIIEKVISELEAD